MRLRRRQRGEIGATDKGAVKRGRGTGEKGRAGEADGFSDASTEEI